jgi:hypothetical protein
MSCNNIEIISEMAKRTIGKSHWHRYDLFYEAYDHSRRRTVLQTFLIQLDITIYKQKTFEEIFTAIYLFCSNINGLGMLAVYDITASLCRYYNILINKVYIIGGGPKQAVKMQKIKKYYHHFNNIRLIFVEINDVNKAFGLNINNGDVLETFLCKWQRVRSNV